MKAVDWVVDKIVAFGKKIWAKLKALAKKAKDKLRGGDDSPAGKQKRLDKGLAAGVSAVNRYAGRPVAGKLLVPILAGVRVRYGLAELRPVQTGDHWSVFGRVNPERTDDTGAKAGTAATEVTGVVAAYRGIHFKLTWSAAAHDRALRQDLVGRPTFSAAARELAGSRTPDASDVPEADLHAAAQLVQERVKQTKEPSSVRQWWGNKKQEFDSLFLALLQRYVNTYDAFEKEMANPAPDRDLGFTSIPFISTSKNARHSAAYALGGKFIAESEVRRTGVVGRVFVYLFSLRDLAQQDPANVQQLQGAKKVRIKARIIHEGEVTFTGGIPGDNLVGQHDATAGQSPADLGATAQQTAASTAQAQGGLQEW